MEENERQQQRPSPKRPQWADNGKGLIRIGKIARTHGIAGEVELQFSDDAFDRGNAEFFVLDIEGLFVPFFWEEYRFKNNSSIILKLEDYNTDADAKKIVGLTAYYPIDALPDGEEQQLSSVRALSGFTLENAEGTEVGIIDYVDDSTSNILLYVLAANGKELVVPFHEDFLHEYDYRKHTLRLKIPEGILNVND